MSDNPSPSIAAVEERIRRNLGRVMFTARWIMAPIYLGLLVALIMVVVKFVQKLVFALPGFLALSTDDATFLVLTLVDLSLVANLVVIVIFAGWENFVGRLLTRKSGDQPEWFGGLDFSTVKLRLIASIVAIAAIQILETFVHINAVPKQDAAWQLAIMLGIAFVGLILAAIDKLSVGHGGK